MSDFHQPTRHYFGSAKPTKYDFFPISTYPKSRDGIVFFRGLSHALIALAIFVMCIFAVAFATKASGILETFIGTNAANTVARDNELLHQEVASLIERIERLEKESYDYKTELAKLTGSDGVLIQIIGKLQQQKLINSRLNIALQQISATSNLSTVSSPYEEGNSGGFAIEEQPLTVQVTPSEIISDIPAISPRPRPEYSGEKASLAETDSATNATSFGLTLLQKYERDTQRRQRITNDSLVETGHR